MQEPSTEPGPAHTHPGDLVGSTIGRYRIVSRLGSGGQGEVYLADDPRLRRKVALKKLPPELARDREARRRAIDEAVRAGSVSDPRIAEVFDVVEENGDVTLVMEYVEGQTLRERLVTEIPLEEFWDLAIQCVEAVQAAHRGGLLHRDIKPDNIVITPSRQVKILDFGIAKRLPRPEELASMTTQTHSAEVVSGTPPYMSPEAHLNQALDERSDLFSLGVVFYEMLAGRRPFQGTLAEIIDGILHHDPDPPSTAAPGLPADLDLVILKLLSRDRSKRHRDAGELLDDMTAAHRGELAAQAATQQLPLHPEPAAAGPAVRHWPWIAGAVGVLIILASIIVPDFRLLWMRALGMDVLPDRVSAVVLPFALQDEDNDAETAAFTRGLGRVVTRRLNRLGAESGIYVAPGSEVARYDVDSPENARVDLGVTLVFRTRIRASGTELLGGLELVDARRNKTLHRATVRSAWTQPVRFTDALVTRAARMLRIDVSGGNVPAATEPETAGGAYRFYLEGLGTLESAEDSVAMAAAIDLFQKSVSIAPEFATGWAGLARARVAVFEKTGGQEWLDAADDAAGKALQFDETLPDARWVRGTIHSARKEWNEAIPEFQAVIDRDRSYRSAYRGLAEAYERLGLLDKAEAVYEECIAALPRDYHTYWFLGYFQHQHGHDEKTLDTFRRMTEAAPDLSRGYAYYGGLLVQEGRYRQAVDVLQHSIVLRPIDSAFSNLATAYFQLRDFDSAISTYREAIGLGYEDYRMWYNLGDAYYWAPGKRGLAADCYTRALALARKTLEKDPDNILAAGEIADMLPKVGRPDSARTVIEKSLARNPDHPYVRYWAALVAWQLGNHDEALDWLGKAVAAGYSRTWLRDSPIFDEWRELPRFRSLLETKETGE